MTAPSEQKAPAPVEEVTLTIDGIEEHSFRRSIENMLRQGLANEAACRLRARA